MMRMVTRSLALLSISVMMSFPFLALAAETPTIKVDKIRNDNGTYTTTTSTQLDTSKGKVTVSKTDTLDANGKEIGVGTLTAKDSQGNAVDIPAGESGTFSEAEVTKAMDAERDKSVASQKGGKSTDTTVTVTEDIPGAGCIVKEWSSAKDRLYTCKVEGGFGTVTSMAGALIKYATYITALIGVLMMVVTGIAYMFGEGEWKKTMKEHTMNIIIGLVLLFTIGFILNTFAPWIYSS